MEKTLKCFLKKKRPKDFISKCLRITNFESVLGLLFGFFLMGIVFVEISGLVIFDILFSFGFMRNMDPHLNFVECEYHNGFVFSGELDGLGDALMDVEVGGHLIVFDFGRL
jgi:hypothetical protein